jgi:hypothetical protein
MVDRNDAGSAIGKELLAMSGQMLGWWKRVRDGTLTKVRFAGRLHAQREFRVRFRAVLERGSACGCKESFVCASVPSWSGGRRVAALRRQGRAVNCCVARSGGAF